MCFKRPKPQKMTPPATLPAPEKTAEPEEVGSARQKEDKELFPNGTPELRTDRSAMGGGVAVGTGLRMT